eukprot:scaffold41461_cov66-Phaeocystis_antarctica.AAC.1
MHGALSPAPRSRLVAAAQEAAAACCAPLLGAAPPSGRAAPAELVPAAACRSWPRSAGAHSAASARAVRRRGSETSRETSAARLRPAEGGHGVVKAEVATATARGVQPLVAGGVVASGHPINLLRERCLTVQGRLHPFVALVHERGQQPHQAFRKGVGCLALDGPCADNLRLRAATTAAGDC